MKHRANPRFWRCYRGLPKEIRELADRNYRLLRSDPTHRSLYFKKIAHYWSVRVGLHYRALAVESGSDLVWFWIGSHAEYDKLVGRRRPANKRVQPMRAKKRVAKRRGGTRG